MLRWKLFAIYFAGTVLLLMMALSAWLFGNSGFKLFMKRVGFCFIWPLAMLSKDGRNVLFKIMVDKKE